MGRGVTSRSEVAHSSRKITLHAGSRLARLALQSQAWSHGEPLWVPSVEFSSWSLTQFLAVPQSLWVSRWNSRKVRHERGVLRLQGSACPLPELLQGLGEPLAHSPLGSWSIRSLPQGRGFRPGPQSPSLPFLIKLHLPGCHRASRCRYIS